MTNELAAPVDSNRPPTAANTKPTDQTVPSLSDKTALKKFACDMCNYRTSFKSNLHKHIRTHGGVKECLCNICGYKCFFKATLKKHFRIHTGDQPFLCSYCTYRCSFKSNLVRHMKKHTGEEKKFACAVCEYKCALKQSFVIHMRKHTGEKPFVCNVCGYRCTLNSNLVQHMNSHSGEKPYACNFCEKRYSTRSNLVRHRKTHNRKKEEGKPPGEGDWSYEDGYENFLKFEDVERPARPEAEKSSQMQPPIRYLENVLPAETTVQSPAESDRCDDDDNCRRSESPVTILLTVETSIKSPTEDNARKFVATMEKPFADELSYGSGTFPRPVVREADVSEYYLPLVKPVFNDCRSEVNERDLADTSNYRPEVTSPELYASKAQTKPAMREPDTFNYHSESTEPPDRCERVLDRELCEPDHSDTTVKPTPEDREDASGPCLEPADSSSRDSTEASTNPADPKPPPPDDASKPHGCGSCPYRCNSRSNLLKHMKMHTGKKEFLCSECGYKCYFRATLKKHVRIHSGEQPFACTVCDYRCCFQSNLVRHVRTHTGQDKKYACALCEYRCPVRQSLVSHMKKHTGEKPFCCTVCDYRCALKSNMVQHMNTHTGERTYSCDICDNKYSTRSNLMRHRRVHTDDKQYECSSCDYKTLYKGHLVKHLTRRSHTSQAL